MVLSTTTLFSIAAIAAAGSCYPDRARFCCLMAFEGRKLLNELVRAGAHKSQL